MSNETPAERLVRLHEELTREAFELMEQKNHDYTSGSGDPYANFRLSQSLGVVPEVGILMRMGDKMQRVRTFVERGELQVEDEGLRDAIIDLINYSVLVYGKATEGLNDGPWTFPKLACLWIGQREIDGLVQLRYAEQKVTAEVYALEHNEGDIDFLKSQSGLTKTITFGNEDEKLYFYGTLTSCEFKSPPESLGFYEAVFMVHGAIGSYADEA